MKCKKCNNEDNYGRKYCRECGNRLGKNCLRCGFVNDDNDKYCGGCGISKNEMYIDETPVIIEKESPAHLKYFPQFDVDTINATVIAAEKLRSETEQQVSTTYQQEDIDKLFSE